MKTVFLFFTLLITSAVLAQSEVALLKAVQAKLGKVNNYTATGKMSIDVAFIKAPASNVTVYFKKPDMVKIKKEDGLSIIPKGGVSLNITSILNSKDFSAIPSGNATVKGFATRVIKLIPMDEGNNIVLATMYVDEKNLLVRKAVVTTKENGSYEMEMDYSRYISWGLPDKITVSFNTKEYKLPKSLTFEYEKGGKQPPQKEGSDKGKIEILYYTYSINKGIEDKIFAN